MATGGRGTEMKSLQRGLWRVLFPPIRLVTGALFEGFYFVIGGKIE
jgi:hypothetical protein